MDKSELDIGIAEYSEHLRETAEAFNVAAAEWDLPVRMDPSKAIRSIEEGINLSEVARYWRRQDDSGIVHQTQIRTAVECIPHILEGRRRGHIVGAMQSGKTTTSLALQWVGPIMHLLTGKRVYPFYIIGSQTSHEDQTQTELDNFLAYYGHIHFKLVDDTEPHEAVGEMFKRGPSLLTYKQDVLVGDVKAVLELPTLEDLHRRVGGKESLARIVALAQHAVEKDLVPLMIIDEPQYGASNTIVATSTGTEERKCVLTQIFDSIEGAIGGSRDDHWFIGLSATPFELNDVNQLWEVRQSLTSAYSGFNYFHGRPISPDVEVTPPRVLSMSEFAEEAGVEFLKQVSLSAYDANRPSTFERYARRINFDQGHAAYQRAVEEALREAIYLQLERYSAEGGKPVGMCIRAFNNNSKTQALIARLRLDPTKVEVVEYLGSDVKRMSVKRALALREHKDLPYVIFVTNRARMADAFPVDVRFFMDFAKKAHDLNSLFQGLLGRACGYGKRSTVVLSDANAGLVRGYMRSGGEYIYRTSRHTILVDGPRRGRPTGMLKLRSESGDPVVEEFFRQIDERVVRPNIDAGSSKLKTKRTSGKMFRTGPILTIAEKLEMFDHIEETAISKKLFPEIYEPFHVARKDEAVEHSQQPGKQIRYAVDEEGNCRYTFRWSERSLAAQGGAAGRAKGAKDKDQHMEPTIYVEKYDPATGKVIYDKDAETQKPGEWRAFMVTFPLTNMIHELKKAKAAYPKPTSPWGDYLDESEVADRDGEGN